jgi:hypothetical protein
LREWILSRAWQISTKFVKVPESACACLHNSSIKEEIGSRWRRAYESDSVINIIEWRKASRVRVVIRIVEQRKKTFFHFYGTYVFDEMLIVERMRS